MICVTFYYHECNSYMGHNFFYGSVHVSVSQTGRHMQPAVLDEHSVVLTAKHKLEHRLE